MTTPLCKQHGVTPHCASCKFSPLNAPSGEPIRPMTPNVKGTQCRSYVKAIGYGVRK